MRHRPRVLITLASWTRGISGGDQHILASAGRWAERADVSVVCARGARQMVADAVPEAGIHAFPAAAPASSVGLAAAYLARMVPAFAAARRAGPVDVAVAGSHFLPDAAALLGARAGLRAVFVYHLSAGKGRPAGVHTALALAGESGALAALRRIADVGLTSNGETEATLRRRRWRVARTNVGIELGPSRSTGRREPEYAGAFLGRLMPTKGLDDFVRVVAAIRVRRPGDRFVVIGIGPAEADARELADRLGVQDAIDWAGFVVEERKRELLARSRLLIFPSREEGWGIAVCEALAVGTPAVCYALPVLQELFDPGIATAAVGDPRGLAERCLALLEDDVAREALGRRGRAHVERYDVGAVARAELALLLPGSAPQGLG